MTIVVRGQVRNGQIILPHPLELPEGAEIEVQVSPVPATAAAKRGAFEKLPFVGMAAEREDLADSAAWVRKEREQWHQRASRQD